MTEAREWEASAEQRPGRREILDRITQEAAQLTSPGDRILELGSGPGILAQRLLQRLPDVGYTALDFSPAGASPSPAALSCISHTRRDGTSSGSPDVGPVEHLDRPLGISSPRRDALGAVRTSQMTIFASFTIVTTVKDARTG